jgi:uncharacterized membrane protein
LNTYQVVLYIHLLSLLVGFSAGMIEAVCLLKLRGAETLEAALPWGQLAGQIEKAFPVAIVGLYGSGIYLTHHLWSFSNAWIVIPIVGLALLSLQGPLVAGRQGHKLKHALMANGPGQLGEEARGLTVDRLLWSAAFSNEGVVLAIIWVMTEKPGWGESIAALVIGYAVGVAFALRAARKPAPAAAAAFEPAG